MNTNFNAQFGQVDAHIAHLQFDVHYCYERQGYKCQWTLFAHPSPQENRGNEGEVMVMMEIIKLSSFRS